MSYTTITTDQAARIAKRLANHWRHKFTVSESAGVQHIHFPNATITLTPHENALHISITKTTSDDAFDEAHLQKVVADHVDRMAGETFTYHWQ
ncbi:hypothetical protein B0181_09010 [Moraxella caviae]|uniref:Uncharacterized protein conserved in bacteria (DUF2218) n=1 Tax=Moraxella caviae TaxID=34060 RepID=A0A1S9ZYP1_9GAMM|nr:DUF2218 domain-containing protein [Moraxella caviae]OOR88081.1 hypothetical protein B0181_09010 [Moraxella caviae]STZ09976.1 Uncharacterized protein conserved in bacteria (DUF2218) [Moraxella caviae]